MKKLINKILEKFGYRISRIRDTNEMVAFNKQKILMGNSDSELIIFDAGAYIGDVALKYNNLFPGSKIYCFEPFRDSWEKLKKNTSSFENIVPLNMGLGNFSGVSKFHSNISSPTNSILESHDMVEKIWGKKLMDVKETVEVELVKLDDFVKNNNIRKIDILKLDVQGSEYLVLEGAKSTLCSGIVKMIYTEIITLPTYKGQKFLDEILFQLRSYGFSLFNFYNYSETREGELRQLDAIFVYSGTKIDDKSYRR